MEYTVSQDVALGLVRKYLGISRDNMQRLKYYGSKMSWERLKCSAKEVEEMLKFLVVYGFSVENDKTYITVSHISLFKTCTMQIKVYGEYNKYSFGTCTLNSSGLPQIRELTLPPLLLLVLHPANFFYRVFNVDFPIEHNIKDHINKIWLLRNIMDNNCKINDIYNAVAQYYGTF